MNFFVDLLTTSLYRRGSKIHQTIILENSMRLDFSGKYYFYHFIYDTWQYMTKSRFLSCIVMYPGSPLKQQHTKVFPRRLVTKWSSWTISFTQKRPSWKILIHRKEIPFARHLAWHKYSSPAGCTLRVGTRPHLWGGAHRPGCQIRGFSKIRFALGTRRVGRTQKFRL